MNIKNIYIITSISIILNTILSFNHIYAQGTNKLNEINHNTKIGLTLSGGALSGIAHIGILQAIDKAELNVDYISGTSMGSVIGALYAIGYSGDDIEKLVTETDFMEMFEDKPLFTDIPLENRKEFSNYMIEIPLLRQFSKIIPSGLTSGQTFWLKLSSMFSPVYDIDNFSQFSIPLKVIATNLLEGEMVVLEKGSLADAVRASAAIPSVFTPIEIDGVKLLDGGMVRNFPVKNTIESGANFNIGVNVGVIDSKVKLNSAIEILYHISKYTNMHDIQNEIDACNIYIYLGPSDNINSTMQFNKTGVTKILQKGKKEGEHYYPIFKKIADSLKKNNPNYKFQKNRLPQAKPIYITNIHVSGLNSSSSDNFITTIGIDKENYYSIDEINERIQRVLGKLFYKNIRYNFERDENGDFTIIRFYAEETPDNYLKTSLFFNNSLKTMLTLNFTSKSIFSKNSTSILTAHIGKYPTITFDNIFYNTRFRNSRLLGVGAIYKRSFINPVLYNNFLDDKYNHLFKTHINEDYISASASLFFYNLSPHLGLSIFSSLSFVNHLFTLYNIENTTNTIVNSKLLFTSLGPVLEFDTRDKKFFPTKGLYWNTNAFYIHNIKRNNSNPNANSQYVYNELNKTFINSYNTIQVYNNIDWYFPLTSFLTFNVGSQLGLNFNFTPNDYPINLNQSFIVGGINQNINRNQITFVGLTDGAFIANNAITALVNLQFMTIKNIYIALKANYLGYYNGGSIMKGFKTNLNTMYGSMIGAGIAFTYTSRIGPIQLTLMNNSKTNKLQAYFNFGLAF